MTIHARLLDDDGPDWVLATGGHALNPRRIRWPNVFGPVVDRNCSPSTKQTSSPSTSAWGCAVRVR